MTEFNHNFGSYGATVEDLRRIAYALEEAGFQDIYFEVRVFDKTGDKWVKFLKGVDKRYGYKRDPQEYENHRASIKERS